MKLKESKAYVGKTLSNEYYGVIEVDEWTDDNKVSAFIKLKREFPDVIDVVEDLCVWEE